MRSCGGGCSLGQLLIFPWTPSAAACARYGFFVGKLARHLLRHGMGLLRESLRVRDGLVGVFACYGASWLACPLLKAFQNCAEIFLRSCSVSCHVRSIGQLKCSLRNFYAEKYGHSQRGNDHDRGSRAG